jgi:predicted transcriptional regulator
MGTSATQAEKNAKKILSKVGKRPKTLATIAQQSGMSVATVRNVLHNNPDVMYEREGKANVYYVGKR